MVDGTTSAGVIGLARLESRDVDVEGGVLYRAFISYSHAADGKLAPAVQHALHRIAKPWYRLRTMRLFRDQTNLANRPQLWSSIQAALQESDFFIYLASPTAANSSWVQREVDWWVANKDRQSFLIVLTDGEIAWNDTQSDFDWSRTTALPKRLSGVFREQPLYTDLRWARDVDQLSPRHSRFRPAVLELAATLLDRSKDELDGDDVRQFRRNRRIAFSAIVTLIVLLFLASAAAYIARQQNRIANARALAARSEALLPTDPELALLLALEAVRYETEDQAEYALRQAIFRNPRRMIHHAQPGMAPVARFIGSDHIVAASPRGEAAVWSVASGERVLELPDELAGEYVLEGLQDVVVTLEDSAYVYLTAIAVNDSMFDLYDPRTWRRVGHLLGQRVWTSPMNRLVTAVNNNAVRQWSAPSLQERSVGAVLPETYEVRDVSSDGALLFLSHTGDTSASLIVHAGSGRVQARIPERILRDGTGFSPDGNLVITERMDEPVFEVRSARTGRIIRLLDKPRYGQVGWTNLVTFSADGNRFLSGNRSGELHVWDVSSGRWIGTRHLHRNRIQKIEFSPDGKTMLTSAADGTACLWDTQSMRCLVTLGGQGDDALDAGFAQDSEQFLTTHIDGSVRIWQRESWYPTSSWTGMASGDDARWIVRSTKEGSFQLWDTNTGEANPALEWSGVIPERIPLLAFNHSSSLIAIALDSGVVRLWNGRTGKFLLDLPGESGMTSALAFDRSGALLATAGEDGTFRLWSTREGRLLESWRLPDETLLGLALHPDGRSVAVVGSETVQLREIGSRRIILQGEVVDGGRGAVALNADGRRLLIGGRFSQVLDVTTGSPVLTLGGHTDDVFSAAFSPDGRWVVTGSGYLHGGGDPPDDGNAVRVWDARSGRLLVSYRSAALPVTTVSFSNDGRTIHASSLDGTVRRYECEVCGALPTLREIASARAARALSGEERARYVGGGHGGG